MTALSFTEYLEAKKQEVIDRGDYDTETNHKDADEILVAAAQSAGFGTLCDLYERVAKWYA